MAILQRWTKWLLSIFWVIKSKVKITGNTLNNGNTIDVEIVVPLNYLSIFLRIIEIPLINYAMQKILGSKLKW